MFDFFRAKEKNKNDQTALATALGLDPSLFEDIPNTEEGDSELISSIKNPTTHANTEEAELLKELEKLQLISRQSQNDGNITDKFSKLAESSPSESTPHSQKTMNSEGKTDLASNESINGSDKVPQILDIKPNYESAREVPNEHDELPNYEIDKDPELLRQFGSILVEAKINCPDGQAGTLSTELPPIRDDAISSSGQPSAIPARQMAPIEPRQVLKSVSQTTTSTILGSAPLDNLTNRDDTIANANSISDITSMTPGNMLEEFRKRKSDYVKLALEYKRSGNIDEAKKTYAIAKSMDSSISLLEMGKPVNREHLPPKPNPIDSKKTNVPIEATFPKHVDAHPLHPESGISSADSMMMTFERMEMLIKAQLIECDQLCRYSLLENRREDASKFRKLAEFLKQDLEILLQAKSKHLELPRFSYAPIHLSYKKTLSDIAANELIIQIPRAIGLQSTNETGPLNTFLTCDLPYPMETGTKFQSVAVPSSDPMYNITRKIPIQRNRTLQRILEKKKLIITISNSIRLFSFIPMGSIIYGYVSIDLQPLLTHCDLHEFAEVR